MERDNQATVRNISIVGVTVSLLGLCVLFGVDPTISLPWRVAIWVFGAITVLLAVLRFNSPKFH